MIRDPAMQELVRVFTLRAAIMVGLWTAAVSTMIMAGL